MRGVMDMLSTARRASLQAGLALCLAAGAGCTDASLYSQNGPPVEPDRFAIEGRVCTDDPVTARFPVKVVLVVDQAAGPLFADFDPGGTRIGTLSAFVQSALARPEYQLAVVGYHGRAETLAPTEGNFTRNPGELLNAITRLSLAQPCSATGQCRDYRDGLRSARALIEGDLASTEAGERTLTQYVVVMLNAGEHEPLAPAADCCAPTDAACLADGDMPSAACQTQVEVADITSMRDMVAERGAGGLKVHTVQLTAGDDAAAHARVASSMEQMAFAGGGTYARFDAPGAFQLADLDVLDLRTVLTARHLIVANLNARPGKGGPVADSDADGLTDPEEADLGTDPGNPDSDADGITDLVEVLVAFDPLSPDAPFACDGIRPGADLDRDQLTDCDEALLGTDRSLVDTDGDAMPDRLEVTLLTDYLHRDAEEDIDTDGITNGDEVRDHTDPRSGDSATHLSLGYRYRIEDEGFVQEPSVDSLKFLTGVRVDDVSAGTTPGLGTLRYVASDPPTLQWQDASDGDFGPLLPLTVDGTYTLESGSYAPEQGEDGRTIQVTVDRAALPPRDTAEQVRVVFRTRQCLSFTVRNVQLVETVGPEAGMNNVFLFFSEGPADKPDVPGPFRLAHLPVWYAGGQRVPAAAVIEMTNAEFVSPKVGLVRAD